MRGTAPEEPTLIRHFISIRRPESRFRLPPAKAGRPTAIGGAALADYMKRRSAHEAARKRPWWSRLAPAARTLALLAALAVVAWLGYNSYLALVFLGD